MTNWTIRGADRESGEDRVLEVQAANSDEARRLGEAAGLLIEAVDPEPMVEQSMVPASLNYHRNAPPVASAKPPARSTVPGYLPLLILSRILTVFAMVGYGMVGLIVVLGILLALGVGVGASIRNNSLTGAATGWAAVTMLLFWGLWALFPSLVMHAVAASLAALRDIARSVYRPV